MRRNDVASNVEIDNEIDKANPYTFVVVTQACFGVDFDTRKRCRFDTDRKISPCWDVGPFSPRVNFGNTVIITVSKLHRTLFVLIISTVFWQQW